MKEPTNRQLDRRLTKLEAIIPAIGRSINAIDMLAVVVGNEAPHLRDRVEKATIDTGEAKRILLEWSLYR